MNTRGQIIIPVIILLVFLAIVIPPLVNWAQSESQWTVKGLKTTRAEVMAEAGVDLGLQQLISSSATWANALTGINPVGFNFDKTYTDLPDGTYSIRFSSGPQSQQVTVWSVGKDNSKTEIRTLSVVYQNAVSMTALYLTAGTTVQTNAQIEWGPVVSFGDFVTDSAHLSPRIYSNSAISPLDFNGPVAPNTDNVQWWSYQSGLPPLPQIDLGAYRDAAAAAGAGHLNNSGLGSYTLTGGITPGTYYFDGDLTLNPSTPLNGDLIVLGNLTVLGYTPSGGPYSATLPSTAWKEYGNNWAHYQALDGGAPASFPGQNGTYSPGSLLPTITAPAIHGFVYVRKQLTINNAVGLTVPILGSMLIGQNSLLSGSPTFTLYFDPAVAASVKTLNVPITRISWQTKLGCSWTTTYPTCP